MEDANAFMRDRITHRYLTERNRILEAKNLIEAAANERKALVASLEAGAGVNSDAEPTAATPTEAPASPPRPEYPAKRRDQRAVAAPPRALLTYLGALALIFIGEAIVNKKAFELFSESDRVLWLMVSGVAVSVIVACHLLGKFWKRYVQERQDRAILAFLAVIALFGAVMLGSMRYLSVDNERQDRVAFFEAQRGSARGDAALNRVRVNDLEPKATLTPREREDLRRARGRVAEAEALVATSEAGLADAQRLEGIDNPMIGLPLYVLINILLMGVATALSYHHANPEADRTRAEVATARRERFHAWLSWRFAARRHARAEEDRAKAERARGEQAARAREATRRSERERQALINRAQGEIEQLRANFRTAESTLAEMRRAYSAACDGVEHSYAAAAERYWEAQNRRARQPSQKLKRLHEKAVRRNVKRGLAAPEKPDGIEWVPPLCQRVPLPFVRPQDLRDRDLQSSAA